MTITPEIHAAAVQKIIDVMTQIRDEAGVELAVLPSKHHGTPVEKAIYRRMEFAKRKLREFGVN